MSIRKSDKKIRDPKMQEHLTRILDAFQANPVVTPAIIEDMKALRQRFIEHKQPTIVKSIRLAIEYVDKYNNFDIPYWNEEEDGELTVPMFEYYIGLLANPTNKYNRDEIKEINIVLKDILDENTSDDAPSSSAKANVPYSAEDDEEYYSDDNWDDSDDDF